MKLRTPKIQEKTKSVSMRLDEPLAGRFHRVVEVSKRTKTSVIEECLEVTLPRLEKQYLPMENQAA